MFGMLTEELDIPGKNTEELDSPGIIKTEDDEREIAAKIESIICRVNVSGSRTPAEDDELLTMTSGPSLRITHFPS